MRIGILGCGWLGLPLAKALVSLGYKVKGTTTSHTRIGELQLHGIVPYHIKVMEEEVTGPVGDFLESLDVLVINIPPRIRNGGSENYAKKINALKSRLTGSGSFRVLFASSTSVYGALHGEIDETTPPRPDSESSKQLLEAEQLFVSVPEFNTTVVRFGGLIGPGRHPSNQLSGRKGLKNGNLPVNLIHLEDCLHILISIIEQGWWNCLFNAVYPEHPSREEYYMEECKKRGLPAPEFLNEKSGKKGKIIQSRKLLSKGFSFQTGIIS